MQITAEQRVNDRELNNAAKQDLRQAVVDFGRICVAPINSGAAQVLQLQQRIDQDAQALRSQVGRLLRTVEFWNKSFDQLQRSVSHIGDMKKWASGIEVGLNSTVAALNDILKLEASV
jgi:hypothetical protein